MRFNKDTEVKNIEDTQVESITISKNVKNIKDIKKDFINYKTVTILAYNKLEDGSWKIKCLLNGSKKDVLNDIENIKYYEIIDYNLSYEKNNVSIEANLIYK
ncbi:hypothetical protein [Clostridium sp.]|uniref:hypothetical protein n=1 Tax=Clostridium sp. TaxID=1506 RepID=UPI00290F1217|nr:hypothetical protein [Clostridium sp.]MDU5107104.1 hypothetical protein [Clostridium sp.]